jgi:group I intron endonuclease
MSQISEILCDVELPIQVKSEAAFFLLNDVERFRSEDGKFRIVYSTVNLINGKKYVGQHTTKNLKDGYYGSGALIRRAFKKYGRDNFETGILDYCKNQDELNEKEEDWIRFFKGKFECYNLKIERYNKVTSDEARRQSSKRMKGKPAWNKGLTKETSEIIRKYSEHLSIIKTGTTQSKESNEKRSKKLKGKTFSKEHNSKISRAKIGRKCTYGDRISKTLTGRKQLKITIENRISTIKSLPLIVCPHCGETGKYMNCMLKHHFDNCKQNPNYIPKPDTRELQTCEYCGFQSRNKGTIVKYHGDNCKQNPNNIKNERS